MAVVEVPASAWWVPAVTCRKSCGLGFNERLVWSALLRRLKAGGGSSAESLARQTGLGVHAAKSSCRRLATDRLAACREDTWHALEPPRDIGFVRNPKVTGGPWWGRLRTWRFVVPAADGPLTVAQAAILWLLASLKKTDPTGEQSASCLAKLLGLSRTTASAALERLAELGVVSVIRRSRSKWARSDITFSDPLPVAFPSWWAERKDAGGREVEDAVADPAGDRGHHEPGLPVQPPAARPAPAFGPAVESPGRDREGPQARERSAAWEHNRACFEAALDRVGIGAGHRLRRQLMEVATQVAEQVGRWSVHSDAVSDAASAHDPAKSRDCAGLLLHCLRERLAKARDERRVQDLDAARKATAFAPLAAVGLSSQVACPSCGCRQSAEVGYTPDDRWPDEIRLAVGQVQAVAGVTHVQVGTRSQSCRACRRPWPGLILTCRRWADGEVVGGGRTFPDLEPLSDRAEPGDAPPAEVPADAFLDALGPQPVWEQNALSRRPRPATIEGGGTP